ncbi:similar to MIF domain containing protein [Plenodomus lingam JN3]|uniref:L-dopachrome isomerase n=2 Tax=Leptosphaeria maculans TaxID=5022 RepID=E5A759_LEPMJ|nr:similar to MIF domain containing protein [Plenodomus lingam JN3]CBX99454.1 similar to MIF domain containing protein [Plenodomus lingam JN3]
MSRPSSTSTYSGNNQFPMPAGVSLLSPEKVGEQLSPAQSTFSFASTPRSVQDVDHDDSRHLHPMGRGTTGDATGSLRPRSSRSRAQFYEDSFSYKDGIPSSARDRVTKDAPIVAELRTNVIIKDEYTLVTDLSHHLSTRYQRPETSIMITVNHSACLLLGGSFEPTYILAINALPVQLQPTTNKRNAAMIQTFMAESIGVSPERGIIKFLPIPEDSLAMNGMTILGEIERLERQHAEESGSNVKRVVTKASRKSAMYKAKSSMALSRKSSKANQDPRAVVSSSIPADGPLDSGIAMNEKGITEPASAKVDSKVGHKKSEPTLSKCNKPSNSLAAFTPPPIPADKAPAPGIGKRKSFLSVFRR